MNKNSEKFIHRLVEVKAEIIEEIKRLLKECDIKSINFQPYYMNDYVLNWTFYDSDRNGNGEGLECVALKVENKDIALTMFTTCGSYYGTCFLTDLSACECLYVLHLIEDVIEFSTANGYHILAEDEDFEFGDEGSKYDDEDYEY